MTFSSIKPVNRGVRRLVPNDVFLLRLHFLWLLRSLRPFRNIERYLDRVGWMSDDTWACQTGTSLEKRKTQAAHQTSLLSHHSCALKACRHTRIYIHAYTKRYIDEEGRSGLFSFSFFFCVVFFSFFLVSFFLFLDFCCSLSQSLPSTDYIGVSVGL